MIRIGHGYDVHRLVKGRRLVLCGVDIPFEKGLLGHSDADVAAHAVADSLLGAAAMPDIGQLFPDSGPAFEGADSIKLLKRVAEMLAERGWRASNIDVTVIAQRPKIAEYEPLMEKNIAGACGIPTGAVNVKATTEEGLGFSGSGEGIAAHCVCLITDGGD